VSLHDVVSSKIYTDIRVKDHQGNSIPVPLLTIDDLVNMGIKQGRGDVLDGSSWRRGLPVLVQQYQPAAAYAIEGMDAMAVAKDGQEFSNPRDLFGEIDTPIGSWQSQAEACLCALVGTKERAYQSEVSWHASLSLGHKTTTSQKLNWQAVCRCVSFFFPSVMLLALTFLW
jgi:hypothetical protein